MAAVGDTEDDHQEHEGQHALGDEGTKGVDVPVVGATIGEVLAVVVGGKVARLDVTAFHDGKNDGGSADGTNDLGAPIDEHLFQRHAAIGPNAEADGGIQVGT